MPFPFSSRTLAYLVEGIIASHTRAEMHTLFLKAEVDEWQEDEAPNKEALAQSLLRNLKRAGSEMASSGVLELARLVLKAGSRRYSDFDSLYWQNDTDPPSWWTALRDAASADGWEYDEAKHCFVPTTPVTRTAEEVTWIEDELSRRGWTNAAGHYRQAIESFARGNWAAANSQLRSFFEDLIREGAGLASSTTLRVVQQGANQLHQDGRLLPDEREFILKLWKMLHPRGSHPGLSDKDESRFRLLTLTGYVRFLLSRLP